LVEVKENEDGELYIELDDQALEAAGLETYYFTAGSGLVFML
jgi:hypothetical protein